MPLTPRLNQAVSHCQALRVCVGSCMSCSCRALQRLTSKQVIDHPVRPHLQVRQTASRYPYNGHHPLHCIIAYNLRFWHSHGHQPDFMNSQRTAALWDLLPGCQAQHCQWRHCTYSRRRCGCALAGAVGRLALDGMQACHRGDVDDVALPARCASSPSGELCRVTCSAYADISHAEAKEICEMSSCNRLTSCIAEEPGEW